MPQTATDDPTLADVMATLRSLEEEVRELRRQVDRDELPRLQDLAEELGIARSTMYSKLDRAGIPIRDSHGFPKEGGGAAHVSRTEWEAAEQLDTRTVRRRAGFND